MQNKIISKKETKIGGISIIIERKHIKTIRLSVKPPDGIVSVSAPVSVPEKMITSFVQEKMQWIIAQKQKIAAMPRNILDASDRAELSNLIEIILPKWESVTKLYCSAWQIRDMKTRWGSCNIQTGKIWFSLQLARQPIECIEYVVLHELIHLKIPGHGRDFKEMLDLFMPDWREKRKKLQEYGSK